ncbi:hypothetical protein [Granulicella sp. S156]|jgi:hypothetical protein|nr:hypothetical protein [Granulicella sp. S156]
MGAQDAVAWGLAKSLDYFKECVAKEGKAVDDHLKPCVTDVVV